MKPLACILHAGLIAAATLASSAYAQTPQAPATSPAAKRTTPQPGGEAALRKVIDDIARGEPDYAAMAPPFAGIVRPQLWTAKELFNGFGTLKSLTFKNINQMGWDTYTATFDKGSLDFGVNLDAAGKVAVMYTPPPYPPAERLDDAALVDYTRAQLEIMNFSGAVLVARDGKPVFTSVRGLADREQNIPNKLDTRFRIGSVTKPITAVAVLQLVQAGKIKLDAPVATYIKDYPNKDFASRVTVNHLLTHTAGAGDIFGPQYDAKRLQLKTLEEYVELYGVRAPEFPPGENFRYSNYGYNVLGRIIEEVSGQTYTDYVRDHIFKPAGMTRSGFEPETVAVEGRAKGYMVDPQGARPNTATLPLGATASGGAYSTVGDMLAFATALTGHKLLDAVHTKLLTSRKTSTGYTYGFSDLSNGDVSIIEHAGGIQGGTGNFTIIGDGKAVIVSLSNENPPDLPGSINKIILRRIRIMGADSKVAAFILQPPDTPPATEAQRMAAFKTADTDNDGKLDRAGFKAVLQIIGFADRLNPFFMQYDANRDGFISTDEARNPPQ